MGSLFYILMMLLNIIWWVLIVQVIMSWLISFQVLNTRQPLGAQVWYTLNRMLEPIYGPIRRMLPPMGGLDFTPLIVLFIIAALRIILVRNQGFFFSY